MQRIGSEAFAKTLLGTALLGSALFLNLSSFGTASELRKYDYTIEQSREIVYSNIDTELCRFLSEPGLLLAYR